MCLTLLSDGQLQLPAGSGEGDRVGVGAGREERFGESGVDVVRSGCVQGGEGEEAAGAAVARESVAHEEDALLGRDHRDARVVDYSLYDVESVEVAVMGRLSRVCVRVIG